MSLIFLKLAGVVGLVSALGTGTYAIVKSFNSNSSEIVNLQSLSDFQNHCLVSVIGGDKGNSSGDNRKIFVCPVSNSSSKASFYFYNSNSDQPPKEVIQIQKTSDGLGEITLTFLGDSQASEIISLSHMNWSFLYNKNLKEVCTVSWKDSEKVLSCEGVSTSRVLEKFK